MPWRCRCRLRKAPKPGPEGGSTVIVSMQHRLITLSMLKACWMPRACTLRSASLGLATLGGEPLPLCLVSVMAITFAYPLLVLRGDRLLMPPAGQDHLEGVQPLEEVAERDVVVADHLHLDGVEVEPVLVVAIVFCPPLLLLAEGDGLGPSYVAHHVGARGGTTAQLYCFTQFGPIL